MEAGKCLNAWGKSNFTGDDDVGKEDTLMKNFKDKVAVIIRAPSGMGRELTLQLTDRGAKVGLIDWKKGGLDETLQMIKNKGSPGKSMGSQRRINMGQLGNSRLDIEIKQETR